ncbi:MAG: hypothetical protein ACOYX5_01355 [Actinomycetota bacterium]
MKRTAKHFAAAVLAGSVALGMGVAPAAADGDRDGYSSRHHDGDREHSGDYEKDYEDKDYDDDHDSDRYDGHDDGDRDDHEGYKESRYDGDRDDHGRRGEYRPKDGDHYAGKRKHHWGERDHDRDRDWDGEESEKRDIDWYRDRIAGAQAERKAMKIKAERAKVAHRDGTVKKRELTEADAVAMHKKALVFKLSRAEAFLAGLADRLSDSDMDASVKEPLLEAVATYQARVAQLQVAAENATTKEDLKAIYGQLRELGWEFVSQMVEMRKATVTPKHS